MLAEDVWTQEQADELFDAIHPIRWANQLRILRFVYRATWRAQLLHDRRIGVTLSPEVLEQVKEFGNGHYQMRAVRTMVQAGVLVETAGAVGRRPGFYAVGWDWTRWSDDVPWAAWALDQRGRVSRRTVLERMQSAFAGLLDARQGGVDARLLVMRDVAQRDVARPGGGRATVLELDSRRASSSRATDGAVQCSWRAKALLQEEEEGSVPPEPTPEPAPAPPAVVATAAVTAFIEALNHQLSRNKKPTRRFWGAPLKELNECVTEENYAQLVTLTWMSSAWSIKNPMEFAGFVREEAKRLANPPPPLPPPPTLEELEARVAATPPPPAIPPSERAAAKQAIASIRNRRTTTTTTTEDPEP